MCIKIDIKILLFLVLFYIFNQHKIYLLFMAFIFLHEISHMLIGIILGAKPMELEIKPMGCSISFRYKIDDYNKKILKGNLVELKKIFIYIAGPLFNLIVGIIALLFIKSEEIFYINIIIAFFNLIAIYPLDGGRIFKCILVLLYGELEGYKKVQNISNISIIILLFISSIAILKYHTIGIICGITYLCFIKIKYNKEIKNKIRVINMIIDNN